MTHATKPDPVTRYLQAMAATRDLEAPIGAATLAMLAGAMHPHELVDPGTHLTEGGALVIDGLAGTSRRHRRRLSAPVTITTILGSPGPVAATLGLSGGTSASLATPWARIVHQGSLGLTSPELAATTAVHGLLAAAPNATLRRAVLLYAGLAPLAGAEALASTNAALEAVAELVDRFARRAGFHVEAARSLGA